MRGFIVSNRGVFVDIVGILSLVLLARLHLLSGEHVGGAIVAILMARLYPRQMRSARKPPRPDELPTDRPPPPVSTKPAIGYVEEDDDDDQGGGRVSGLATPIVALADGAAWLVRLFTSPPPGGGGSVRPPSSAQHRATLPSYHGGAGE